MVLPISLYAVSCSNLEYHGTGCSLHLDFANKHLHGVPSCPSTGRTGVAVGRQLQVPNSLEDPVLILHRHLAEYVRTRQYAPDWPTHLHAVRVLVGLAPVALVEGVGWWLPAHDGAETLHVVALMDPRETAVARIGVRWSILDLAEVCLLEFGC